MIVIMHYIVLMFSVRLYNEMKWNVILKPMILAN